MTEIPEGARTPTDHQRSAAQIETEGGGESIVHWNGLDFTIPSDIDDLPGEFLEAAEAQQATVMVRLVLGPKQFKQFKAAKPKVRDYREVGDQIAVVYGFEDSGN